MVSRKSGQGKHTLASSRHAHQRRWVKLVVARASYESGSLSQEDLASLLGVDQGTISGWELLMHRPRVKSYERLAEFLGCSVSDLATEIDSLFPS